MSRVQSARTQILETAAALFYERGYHAIGIDLIVQQSGVAKMTLYRHFPSKDDLIVAYLEDANTRFWHWFDEALAAADPAARLEGLFAATADLAGSVLCLGCAFQMAAVEFPDPTHPAYQVARRHKEVLLARLEALAAERGAPDAAGLAQALYLLMEGAWAARRMFGLHNPGKAVGAAARAVLAASMT